jgi:SAM-dependent methyltransferase
MSRVKRFYDQNPQYEWERLERHRTEFAVTMRALEDYLPKPPAKILDVGGGPGRYAIALTQRGYEATLFDISQGCLDLAAFTTRYAPIRWAAKYEPQWVLEQRERLAELLTSGVLRARPEGGFTDAYFIYPAEVRPLMEGEGFQTLDLIACEGMISLLEEKVNDLAGELWEAWVELNYRVGRDPAVHGAAAHLLYVGERAKDQ